MVWHSHLCKFSAVFVIHTVKGFCMVNRTEVDVFLELSCFFHDPLDVGNLISGSSAFSKSSFNIWNFTVKDLLGDITLVWNFTVKDLLGDITLVACEMSATVW